MCHVRNANLASWVVYSSTREGSCWIPTHICRTLCVSVCVSVSLSHWGFGFSTRSLCFAHQWVAMFVQPSQIPNLLLLRLLSCSSNSEVLSWPSLLLLLIECSESPAASALSSPPMARELVCDSASERATLVLHAALARLTKGLRSTQKDLHLPTLQLQNPRTKNQMKDAIFGLLEARFLSQREREKSLFF